MSSTAGTLTDASPTSSVLTLAVSSPRITFGGLQPGDQVAIYHAMDGADPETTEDTDKAIIVNHSGPQDYTGFDSGDRIMLVLNPNGADSTRTVKYQVQT